VGVEGTAKCSNRVSIGRFNQYNGREVPNVSSKISIVALLCVSFFANSRPASAQQVGGFPNLGHIGPSTGEVVGVIVGAAVAIGVVVYLVIPKQKTIEGCIEVAEGGLRLTADRDKRVYSLEASSTVSLQPGQRVVLKGKLGKKHDGIRDFEVRKLTKDQGSCSVRGLIQTLPIEIQAKSAASGLAQTMSPGTSE